MYINPCICLSLLQAKTTSQGSRGGLDHGEAAAVNTFEFPSSSPEKDASPIRARLVAMPPPRRRGVVAATGSPATKAAAGVAPSGSCLQPSPSSAGAAASAVTPHSTPTQSRKALLPPRPNQPVQGHQAKGRLLLSAHNACTVRVSPGSSGLQASMMLMSLD